MSINTNMKVINASQNGTAKEVQPRKKAETATIEAAPKQNPRPIQDKVSISARGAAAQANSVTTGGTAKQTQKP